MLETDAAAVTVMKFSAQLAVVVAASSGAGFKAH